MAAVIMRVVARADGQPFPFAGQFVRKVDLDAHDGRGLVEFTPDPRQALRFACAFDALALWRSESKARPTRRDGQPNRPLTATSIEIVEAP
jgi:hypothetical protein